MAPRLAIAVVCAALAAAVLIGRGGATAPEAAGAQGSPPMLAFTASTRGSPLPQVFTLRRDGTLSQITHGTSSRVVSWSPDGRELLVIRTTHGVNGGETLEALRPADGHTRGLWTATTLQDAAWSPDGRYIAMEWDRKVSVLDAGGQVVRPLGERVPRGPAGKDGLAWSAEGTRLAVTYATPGGSGIAIEQPRGVLPRIMSPCGRERPCSDVLRPDWAAGSDALVMVRTGRIAGSLWWWTGHGPPRRFPARGMPDGVRRAAWAPDGHRLAVATAHGVFLVGSPGGPAERVTATSAEAGPAWSADGRRIAIAARSLTSGPDVLYVLVLPRLEGRTPFLQTSALFERITGPLVWNPAG